LINRSSQGWYRVEHARVQSGRQALLDALQRLDQPVFVVETDDGPAVATGGQAVLGGTPPPAGALPLLAYVPPLTPDRLGDPTFQDTYGVRVNYLAGAMANGIGSAEIVVEMARAGMMGFYGAAGLPLERVGQAIDRIQEEVADLPYGFNLIHNPQEPQQEWRTVDLYLERGVRTVSASAYLGLTPMVAAYRLHGIHTGPDGRVRVPNRVLAKVSREEVATHFLNPAPEPLLRALVERGRLTVAEAGLAARVPMADDLTAEADSGGHTDNRPLPVLLPLLCALRDRICAEHGYPHPVRVGAAGGLATPASIASAFALGAAYVLTGTVNQACVEAGTSPMVKEMLAEASSADVGMAPASDMFEAGVRVQVLKRGTLFAMRGEKLYNLYRRYGSLEALPDGERSWLETQVLRRPVDEVWRECEAFFAERDPRQLDRAATDPGHKMALVFRWYLGLSSRWAVAGDPDRRTDAQIWCGPAIGAFNDWTRGTWLADPAARRVVPVAANLMAGAAAITRAHWLLQQGVSPGPEAERWIPRPVS
jgi:PfaD family protein